MQKPVIIFGAGDLARQAIEIFMLNNVPVYGFLDDDKNLHGSDIFGIPVLGSTEDEKMLKLIGHDCNAFVCMDEVALQKSIVKLMIQKKQIPVNAVHPKAIVSTNAILNHGNLIEANVFIGSGLQTGSYNQFKVGAILNYGGKIGNYCQIGPGAIVDSDVTIEDEVFIGAGARIISGLKIGKGARIGAGSVAINEINANETVFGNPAKSV